MVGVESARVMGTLVCFLRDTERECTYSGVCVCVCVHACVCAHTSRSNFRSACTYSLTSRDEPI